ncbi:MAG TPA: toxin-antitoxin system, antitoxin component, Xre family protein [Thermoanaerobaculia bacterium]|jgi:hypothetical protein|nr:toxin-antitoxin system, antitoxin component, Xre family protein [Thermoanaerobaculia bacterium]
MSIPLRKQDLLEKIRTLPEDRVTEVEDFVDFIRQREEDRRLSQAVAKLSEPALQRVWDNPDDAEYDLL